MATFLSETDKLFSEQYKYGSYIRSLMEDFSVIDIVQNESRVKDDE